MPYSNPKQPMAAFLNIKRRQGLDAAKAFGRKHRSEMSNAAKQAHGQEAYKPRAQRMSKSAARGEQRMSKRSK